MTASLIFGQQGTGKSTVVTGEALDYMRAGRRVVSNFPIDPAPAVLYPSDPIINAVCEVIPPRPVLSDLVALGLGWLNEDDIGREDKCGVIIIDEAGPWLSAREWNGQDRKSLIDFLVQTRKRGWDLIFIAHTPIMIDKQVRDGVIEIYGRCRRTDRMKKFGFNLPRVHLCVMRYGPSDLAPMVERKTYRGKIEHACFQSYSVFSAEDTEQHGWYSVLPPRLTTHRNTKEGVFSMKTIVVMFLIIGSVVGFVGGNYYASSDSVAVASVPSETETQKPATPSTVAENSSFRLFNPDEAPPVSDSGFNSFIPGVAQKKEISLSGCYATPKTCSCTNSDGSDSELEQSECMAYLNIESLPAPSGELGLAPLQSGRDYFLEYKQREHRRLHPNSTRVFVAGSINDYISN